MIRFRTVACLLLILSCSTALLAHLHMWNPAKRPPVSLAAALTLAEKALGDEAAKQYCVSVSLYGSGDGLGKEGKWNLLFATNDGSRKNVTVDMQSRVEVHLWSGPESDNQESRRQDLAELKQKIEAIFQVYKIPAKVVLENDVLRVDYLTRDFLVYQMNDQEEYTEEQVTMRGPKADGIWLEVRLTKKADRRDYHYDYSIYWSGARGTRLTAKPGIYFAIDLRYGNKVLPALTQDLRNVFGPGTR